jgi:peptidoglycan/LPS O-acetylase OafA/YrhL
VKRGDIPVLHGIRGCLALWVLLGHTLAACGAYIPVLSAPGVAVYAFMVMSGFLMALHFRLREEREPWESPKTWALFYTRRFCRIAPIYYLALIVAFALQGAYMTMAHYTELRTQLPLWYLDRPKFVAPFDATSLSLHATFLFGLIPSQASNNILPDWSIGLEMQFYFVFPFIMLLLRRVGAFWFSLAALALFVIAQSLALTFPQPSFLPLVLTAFVIGILMSEAWLEDDRLKSAALLVLATLLASIRLPFMFQAIPVAMMFLINFPSLYDQMKLTVLGGSAVAILGGRVGLFMGDRSYSVYLIHMLVLIPVVSALAIVPWFGHAAALAKFAIVAPMMVVICYSLGSATLVLIENPFIAIGRKIVQRWRRAGTLVVVSAPEQ